MTASRVALAVLLLATTAAAEFVEAPWREVSWGETSDAIARHFGARARRVAPPLDYGDSYVDLVLRDVTIGGFNVITYFQMDKRTRGLKRVQLERPRHGVSPVAAQAIQQVLLEIYGAPDRSCSARPREENGWQSSAELDWRRDGETIRLVLRDMTFDPGAGCAFGGGAVLGVCGLPAQILIRVAPAGADGGGCD
jgi:hypothetical protein